MVVTLLWLQLADIFLTTLCIFLHAHLSQIVPETQKIRVLIPKADAVGQAAPCHVL